MDAPNVVHHGPFFKNEEGHEMCAECGNCSTCKLEGQTCHDTPTYQPTSEEMLTGLACKRVVAETDLPDQPTIVFKRLLQEQGIAPDAYEWKDGTPFFRGAPMDAPTNKERNVIIQMEQQEGFGRNPVASVTWLPLQKKAESRQRGNAYVQRMLEDFELEDFEPVRDILESGGTDDEKHAAITALIPDIMATLPEDASHVQMNTIDWADVEIDPQQIFKIIDRHNEDKQLGASKKDAVTKTATDPVEQHLAAMTLDEWEQLYGERLYDDWAEERRSTMSPRKSYGPRNPYEESEEAGMEFEKYLEGITADDYREKYGEEYKAHLLEQV